MHNLTNKPGRTMQLRIFMEKFSGEKATSFYDAFRIGDQVLPIYVIESENIKIWPFLFQNTFYKLDVSGYHGNGGDAFNTNGMAFTTYDQDHDTA